MSKKGFPKTMIFLLVYLLLVWGGYRLFFNLPKSIEELVIKPVVWIIPLIYLVVVKEKKGLLSLGLTWENLFPAIYFALALGSIFALEAVVLNYVKYGGFNFGANIGEDTLLISLGYSFATAFSEELVFRGYMFNRLWAFFDNEWKANVIGSLAWVLIHLPITIFVLGLSPGGVLLQLMLVFVYGVGSSFVFARTKNVFSSIFLHVLWSWPIILFR